MKHRGNIYCVVRNSEAGGHVVGVYKDWEQAQDVVDAFNQDVLDGELPQEFHFEVQLSQYYAHG